MTTIICNIEKLIQKAKNAILNKSRKSRTGIGFDDTSAVDGETFIKEYISTIAGDLSSKLFSPLSRDLTDPYINGIEYGGNDIVYSVEFPSTFDMNTIPAVTQATEDTIVSYCVSQWMMDLNILGWEKYELEHTNKYDNLRSLLTRRINLVRTYKLY